MALQRVGESTGSAVGRIWVSIYPHISGESKGAAQWQIQGCQLSPTLENDIPHFDVDVSSFKEKLTSGLCKLSASWVLCSEMMTRTHGVRTCADGQAGLTAGSLPLTSCLLISTLTLVNNKATRRLFTTWLAISNLSTKTARHPCVLM